MDEPEDCFKALRIGREFALSNAPGHQSAIFVQADGAGHKLHVHIYTNDVRISDHKGLESEAYEHWNFRKLVDKICEKYIGKPDPTAEMASERVTRAVRGARIANEQIKKENSREIRQAIAEDRPVDHAKMKLMKYIWQDDLRERIRIAAMFIEPPQPEQEPEPTPLFLPGARDRGGAGGEGAGGAGGAGGPEGTGAAGGCADRTGPRGGCRPPEAEGAAGGAGDRGAAGRGARGTCGRREPEGRPGVRGASFGLRRPPGIKYVLST